MTCFLSRKSVINHKSLFKVKVSSNAQKNDVSGVIFIRDPKSLRNEIKFIFSIALNE